MDKFQDAYRSASQELPGFRMDAEKVRDEVHHYRMQRQGRKYLLVRGCTAAAVFLLCGAGTVAAKNIRNSIIQVREGGVTISGTTDRPSDGSDEWLPDVASMLKEGGVFSIEDDIPEAQVLESYETELTEYNSLEAFFAADNIVLAVPDMALLGEEFTTERVVVMDEGRDVQVTLSNEDTSLSMLQSDNREFENYSTGITFGGSSANEREFANSQGISYVMFDSVDEEGHTESVLAVVSVNGRDLTITFRGFEEDVIEKTLFSLDLTVYYED